MPFPRELYDRISGMIGKDDVDARIRGFLQRLLKRLSKQEKEPKDAVLEDILVDLNFVGGTTFRMGSMVRRLIEARMKDGHGFEDFQAVHRQKFEEWRKHDDMRKYYRPTTLYRKSNFERYLEESRGGVCASGRYRETDTAYSGW